jgi:hypothetical protein
MDLIETPLLKPGSLGGQRVVAVENAILVHGIGGGPSIGAEAEVANGGTVAGRLWGREVARGGLRGALVKTSVEGVDEQGSLPETAGIGKEGLRHPNLNSLLLETFGAGDARRALVCGGLAVEPRRDQRRRQTAAATDGRGVITRQPMTYSDMI